MAALKVMTSLECGFQLARIISGAGTHALHMRLPSAMCLFSYLRTAQRMGSPADCEGVMIITRVFQTRAELLEERRVMTSGDKTWRRFQDSKSRALWVWLPFP